MSQEQALPWGPRWAHGLATSGSWSSESWSQVSNPCTDGEAFGALLLTWAQSSAAEQEQGPTGPKATLELRSCFHRSLGIFWALNITTQVRGERPTAVWEPL